MTNSNPDKGKGLFYRRDPLPNGDYQHILMSSCEITQGWFRKVTGFVAVSFRRRRQSSAEKVELGATRPHSANALSDSTVSIVVTISIPQHAIWRKTATVFPRRLNGNTHAGRER